MLQIKDKKYRYYNGDKKRKTAFHGHGFSLNSKTYEKSKNWTKQIIQQKRKNLRFFFQKYIQGGRI